MGAGFISEVGKKRLICGEAGSDFHLSLSGENPDQPSEDEGNTDVPSVPEVPDVPTEPETPDNPPVEPETPDEPFFPDTPGSDEPGSDDPYRPILPPAGSVYNLAGFIPLGAGALLLFLALFWKRKVYRILKSHAKKHGEKPEKEHPKRLQTQLSSSSEMKAGILSGRRTVMWQSVFRLILYQS